MMANRIFFIRHGEVENLKQVVYGRLSKFGLSKKGQEQVLQIANFLKSKSIKNIYSSPLLRTKQTAQIIQENIKLPKVLLDNDLLESRSFIQGHLISEFEALNTNTYFAKSDRKDDETMEEIYSRMKHFLNNILQKNTKENIVAVSHGDPIFILKLGLLKQPFISTPLTRWTKIPYISRGEVWELNFKSFADLSFRSVFKPTP